MLPKADEVDFVPPLDATVVPVRRLVSSEANTITFLLLALGTLMFPKSNFGLPACVEQELPVVALAATEQTTAGIRNALENEPPPEPPD